MSGLRSGLKRRLKPVVARHSGVVGSVLSVRTDAPRLVLSYDDGPDPVGTEAVLAALAEVGATATFFVLMTRVRLHSGLLAEVRAAGHEIGLHGPDHRPLSTFSHHAALARTRDAKAELEDRLGVAVRWFRPPYGRQTPATWLAVRRCGLEPVLWGPTLWDWRDIDQEARVAKSREGIGRGSIVLGHDGFAGPADGAAPELEPVLDRGDLTRRVLAGWAEAGLSATSLARALSEGTPVRAASFHR